MTVKIDILKLTSHTRIGIQSEAWYFIDFNDDFMLSRERSKGKRTF